MSLNDEDGQAGDATVATLIMIMTNGVHRAINDDKARE